MLLATVNPEAAAAIGTIKKVGVGNIVVYNARAGHTRQGRLQFPAVVLKQHADDGSLDLFVIMEPEDVIMEQRVQFQSHNQPHHCWSVVEDVPVSGPPATADPGSVTWAEAGETIQQLIARITALENRPKPGRQPKKAA